jgi:hypothetical protein
MNKFNISDNFIYQEIIKKSAYINFVLPAVIGEISICLVVGWLPIATVSSFPPFAMEPFTPLLLSGRHLFSSHSAKR